MRTEAPGGRRGRTHHGALSIDVEVAPGPLGVGLYPGPSFIGAFVNSFYLVDGKLSDVENAGVTIDMMLTHVDGRWVVAGNGSIGLGIQF